MHKVKPGYVYQYPGADRTFFIAIAVIEPPEGTEGVQQVFGIEIGTDPREEVAILNWRNSGHLGNSHRGAPQWKWLAGVGVEKHQDHELFNNAVAAALSKLEEAADTVRAANSQPPVDLSSEKIVTVLGDTVTEVRGSVRTGSGRPVEFSFKREDGEFDVGGLRELASAIEQLQK